MAINVILLEKGQPLDAELKNFSHGPRKIENN